MILITALPTGEVIEGPRAIEVYNHAVRTGRPAVFYTMSECATTETHYDGGGSRTAILGQTDGRPDANVSYTNGYKRGEV